MYPDCLYSRLSALPPIDNRLYSAHELLRITLQRTTAPRDCRFPLCLSYFHAVGRVHNLLPLPSPYSLSLSWNLTGETRFTTITIYNILETIPGLDYISFLVIYVMV